MKISKKGLTMKEDEDGNNFLVYQSQGTRQISTIASS